jgi:hypothetical protein
LLVRCSSNRLGISAKKIMTDIPVIIFLSSIAVIYF